MIESANVISDIQHLMNQKSSLGCTDPIPGLCLFTAASIHTFFAIHEWESLRAITTEASSRRYLKQDMEELNLIGHNWSLAFHWVGQSSVMRRTWAHQFFSLVNRFDRSRSTISSTS